MLTWEPPGGLVQTVLADGQVFRLVVDTELQTSIVVGNGADARSAHGGRQGCAPEPVTVIAEFFDLFGALLCN